MWEDENHLFVEAELPGLEADKIEVLVQGNQLTLRGKREFQSPSSGTWHRRERSNLQFHRVIELSHDVKQEDLTADYKQGVLVITLPKSEAAKPIRITVNSQ
ncbi:MAG: Hsp20/alpha crystallin family protein [Pirellulaceae bacterium]